MAKHAVNTFSKLNGTLRSLGFRSVSQPGQIIFVHSSGRPVILLPQYKNGQTVRPIHLMMIKKQLADAGLLDPADFPRLLQSYRPRSKAMHADESLAKKP
jgi:hypothetical protein